MALVQRGPPRTASAALSPPAQRFEVRGLATGGRVALLATPAAAAASSSTVAPIAFVTVAAGAACVARRRRRTVPAGRHVAVVCQAATETKERKLTERQEQFWEMLEEDFETDVIPEFGRKNFDRVYEFIKYCKYEKEVPELPELQELDCEFFPGLRAKPWWDTEECGEWIQKVKDGLPYVQGELADILEEDEEAMMSDSVKNNVMGDGWSGLRLQRLGDWISKNCARFPETVQLLKDSKAPLAMRGVIVARQIPQSGVAPHSDGRNIFLTAHFGLSIPEDCSITVGGVTKEWEEDGCVVLDTSFIHSTKNNSEEDRFVLIVDFWHPDLTEEEREGLEYIYDFRNKFEQGKIRYIPKMPENFWDQLDMLSPNGGAYTEEGQFRNRYR